MTDSKQSNSFPKKAQRNANKALLIFFILFAVINVLDILGFQKVANLLMFLPLVAFFIAFFNSIAFIKQMFKRMKIRVKNKQEIFTEDLMDDENKS